MNYESIELLAVPFGHLGQRDASECRWEACTRHLSSFSFLDFLDFSPSDEIALALAPEDNIAR
jgi:hypothetical protein